MRGAALSFYGQVPDPADFDIVFATDLMGVADIKALWGAACPPIVLYFHENQLSYPVPEGEKLDYHFGFTNITSGLAADWILFNSQFHLDSFFAALPGFIGKMPKKRPFWTIEKLREKSSVLYPGCRFMPDTIEKHETKSERPLIVWNHRWEFDKDPDTFFKALEVIDEKGLDFDLALLGENFQMVPKQFIKAKERYGDRIVVYGHVDSREDYYRWLAKGDVVVSTSLQENFGISIIEAIHHGCFPVLPTRLAYPEVLPKQFHEACLYNSFDELVEKLMKQLRVFSDTSSADLARSMNRYSWAFMIAEYETLFDEIGKKEKY
ncbi:MAG: DUF3524 domain-containing protein [Spirochaetales bacterium]|jgi:glycosyltransferase involved in cell wall biosynthesis|nr:DUF3524 domain-containing protein [Spirochaetales bacterium]